MTITIVYWVKVPFISLMKEQNNHGEACEKLKETLFVLLHSMYLEFYLCIVVTSESFKHRTNAKWKTAGILTQT